MHDKFGTSYHWIPELYRHMKLPVFDGVQEALERYNVQRKRALDEYKTEARKKRTVQLKVQRTKESQRRMEWSKKHGHDTYGHDDDDLECASAKVASKGRKEKTLGKCRACGSSTHQRSNHKWSEHPWNSRVDKIPYNTARNMAFTQTATVDANIIPNLHLGLSFFCRGCFQTLFRGRFICWL